jgi:predicted methyltransferase
MSKDVDGIVKQVYEALKPGGFFAIVDHSAPAGTGDAYARSRDGQHRIDEALVKEKLAKAGFKLEAESDLLRNPDDDRSKAFFAPEMQGKNTDKFALLFRKPR